VEADYYSSKRRKIQFETVTTGEDNFADYPKPKFVDEIFKKVRTERVVLVGGNSIPETSLYPKETLESYLLTGLKKKGLDLPVPQEEIVSRLSKPEQIDLFMDLLAKSDGKKHRSAIQSALEISARDDQSIIEPWFYSLSNLDKLIVIGITLFDGAYEGQVFAGYDRILDACWKQRNKALRSIDYEDLIPLSAYFRVEGKIIQGTRDNQRRKVIRIA